MSLIDEAMAAVAGGEVTGVDSIAEIYCRLLGACEDYLFGPRDIPHRYRSAPDGCRMLFIFTPGGFEDLLKATRRPAASRTLPPAGDDSPPSEEAMQQMLAVIQAHGCELLE